MSERDPDPPVPRIGRGRMRPRFPLVQLVQIMMLITALVAVLIMREGCAKGVSNWFGIVAPSTEQTSQAPDARR